MKFPIENYDCEQIIIFNLGILPQPEYANISDLDPRFYDAYQMEVIALGRGSSSSFMNIDHLDPVLFTSGQMNDISNLN